MSDLIERQDVLNVLRNLAFDHTFQYGEYYGEDERQLTIINAGKAIDIIESLPSVEPETITIEEISNQLGYATIQSALYWFEFLKTLDLLGFAIVRKEIK